MDMARFKFIIIGSIFSIGLYIITVIFNLDLFEFFVNSIAKLEIIELDELIIPIFIFVFFVFLNILINFNKNKILLEKTKIYSAMLHSLHHILNNFINQAQIVKIEAESSKDFNKEVLEIYDNIIDEAYNLTRSLESVDQIDEKNITDSVKPKV